MSKLALVLGLVASTLAIAVGALAHPNDPPLPDEDNRLRQLKKIYTGGVKGGSSWNMEVVGQHTLGGRGNNADVYVHGSHAYVGQWVTNSCPSSGVAVLDVANPSDPHLESVLSTPAGAWAEDVVVYTAQSGPDRGKEIAVASWQVCGDRYDRSVKRGLGLWDVTDAHEPVFLGHYDTGCCARGVHEFEVAYRADLRKTYAYVAIPYAELDDTASPTGVRDQLRKGEFRIVDITNPAAPVEVSNWGARTKLGLSPTAGQGCFSINFGHSTEPSEDGKTVFVSYWDAGFMTFDVTNPANPALVSRTTYPASADGDAHSSSYDDARKLLFTGDEDFCKSGTSGTEKGWGFLRVWDYANPKAPVQIGSYRTPNSTGMADPGAGDYTIHNPLVVGTDVYISWYTDGIRVLDASNPRAPVEVANFVPPAGQTTDPPANRNILTNTTQVWGVDVDDETGLVYASDMNTGLWILRRTDT
jgi:hypothetical protein